MFGNLMFLAAVALIVLKLIGVIAWPWLVLLIPVFVVAATVVFSLLVFGLFIKKADSWDKRF